MNTFFGDRSDHIETRLNLVIWIEQASKWSWHCQPPVYLFTLWHENGQAYLWDTPATVEVASKLWWLQHFIISWIRVLFVFPFHSKVAIQPNLFRHHQLQTTKMVRCWHNHSQSYPNQVVSSSPVLVIEQATIFVKCRCGMLTSYATPRAQRKSVKPMGVLIIILVIKSLSLPSIQCWPVVQLWAEPCSTTQHWIGGRG